MTLADNPATVPTAPASLPWGAITHPKCGGWWTGAGRAHCPVCCRTFSCDSAADKHRKGPHGAGRRCVDPTEVGLVARRMSYGLLWQNPGPDPVVSGVPAQWARGDAEGVA